ncbi:MAG: D-2-hydroxyacid dehydrogenase [Parvibaculaceae bacterium]|nr:D-2-hydroxyacid dehydrogenase [Parvibaculaceae bacterium]
MQRIVFLDRSTIAPQIHLRDPGFPHEMIAYPDTGPDQIVERLKGATIAITNKVILTAGALSQLPGLRLIAVAATGTDTVDRDWCQHHGVAVANIRGYALNTVPEHAFALMLTLRRAIIPYRDGVLAGKWQEADQFCFFDGPVHDLNGARIGIIGAGVIGRRVAEMSKAFGMMPMFAARKGKANTDPAFTPWDEVLETCDVLTLHCPLTPESAGMIGMAEFRQMRRRPLLINTARGGIVIEEDLEIALDQGLVSGAGLDVTLPEPPPADGVLMRMAKRSNVIVTPHVAWASDEAQQILADQLIDNIENFVAGRPSNLVTGIY